MSGAAFEATLERVLDHRPGTRSLFLRLPPDRAFVFTPGQFVSLEVPADGAATAVRAYSIASNPRQPHRLEICVDLVPGGAGSAYLFALAPGAPITFKGPFGSFTVADPPDVEMVFLADATAIAPIRPIVHHVIERGGSRRITILHGARHQDELLFRGELEELAARTARLRYEPVLEGDHRLQVGENPRLEALVDERFIAADDDRSRHFWLCAVGPLVRRLRDALRGAGYERRAVRYEQW